MLYKTKLILIIFMIFFLKTNVSAEYDKLAYDFKFTDLDGTNMNLSEFKDKIILVVNVASQCGFTKQYEGMQKLWENYQKKGLIVIGVPSNDFGNQEPGSNEEIKNFCVSKFNISFPMTEKEIVIGEKAHPFYKWAKKNFGKSSVPKWNFHKIIIGKDGKIIKTFNSFTKPSSTKFTKYISNLLE